MDLLRELNRLRPTVVHFSGHGERTTPANEAGLVLRGPDGEPQRVGAEALEQTFRSAGSVALVVLNACYSDQLVHALLRSVPCVVGMRGPVFDDAARAFSVGLYGALAERESLARAYAQGCAAIRLFGVSGYDRPQLAARGGIEVEKLVLAAVPSGGAVSSQGGTGASSMAIPNMNAVIHGGSNPIIAQNSTVHVASASPGERQREELARRAQRVSMEHLNDPVAQPRQGHMTAAGYALLLMMFLLIVIALRLVN